MCVSRSKQAEGADKQSAVSERLTTKPIQSKSSYEICEYKKDRQQEWNKMISDSKYEHYYNKNHSRAYHAITTCPLFKTPEVVDEDEEQTRKRTVRTLKNQCINKITSYNQVYYNPTQ